MLTLDEKAVLRRIDDRKEDLVDCLVRLIRFRTVTPLFHGRADGDDYSALQSFLSDRLAALDFDVEMWQADASALERFPGSGVVPDRDLRNMPVLVARREGPGPSLLLNGHYDVVPPGVATNWRHPPFEGVVEGDRVFGRGACDMKAGLAAIVEALRCIVEASGELPGTVVVESVPDEEMTSMGTLACCQRNVRADAAIIPEPTDLQLLVAVRGSFGGRIIVSGRAGHSELAQPPWREGGPVNAISKAAKVVDGLERLNAEWATRPDKRHRYLPPDTIVPTIIRGGEWDVMYPERVEITFDSMFVPSTRDKRAEIQAALDRIAMEDDWMREHPPVLEAGDYLYGAEIREDEPIVQTASAALTDLGMEQRFVGSGSLTDMVHLINYAKVPTVCVGPSYRTAHAADEHVTVDELVTTTKALALMILRWCSRSDGRTGT